MAIDYYYVVPDACIQCESCFGVCPVGALVETPTPTIDPSICFACGACADMCGSGAILPHEATPPPTGYSHKPYRIDPASVSKVCTVVTVSISKIGGI